MKRLFGMVLIALTVGLASCSQNEEGSVCCQCDNASGFLANLNNGVCWEDISDNNVVFDSQDEWVEYVENQVNGSVGTSGVVTCQCN